MIARSEKQILRDSLNEFKQIIEWVISETDGMPIHEVERSLHEKLLGIGNLLLRSFVEKEGVGLVGETLTLEAGAALGYVQNHRKTYFSTFGKLAIDRGTCGQKGKGKGYFPLTKGYRFLNGATHIFSGSGANFWEQRLLLTRL